MTKMTNARITIRGIGKEKLQKFKSEAAMHGMKMGEFFGYLVDEHRAHEITDDIKEILGAASHVSKKTIAEIEKAVQGLKK